MKAALLLALALLGTPVLAHEVKLTTDRQAATVVRLTYANGQAFAFEAYELYLPGQEIPEQVGRSNGQGQVIFLAGTHDQWRLKAYTADGHGIDQVVKVTPNATEGTPASTGGGELPRPLLLAAGLGIVFGLFGLAQLFLRKK